MQIYLWVVIILLNVASIIFCIKTSIMFNKMVDENIELLQDNLRLKLENNEYEQIIDTLLQSNLGMQAKKDKNAKMVKINKVNVPTVKDYKKTVKRGRPRKIDKEDI
jgi:hypothetical protein